MEVGEKFKHSVLRGYFFEITGVTKKGYKGIETIDINNKKKTKIASYNKEYFKDKNNGWMKI